MTSPISEGTFRLVSDPVFKLGREDVLINLQRVIEKEFSVNAKFSAYSSGFLVDNFSELVCEHVASYIFDHRCEWASSVNSLVRVKETILREIYEEYLVEKIKEYFEDNWEEAINELRGAISSRNGYETIFSHLPREIKGIICEAILVIYEIKEGKCDFLHKDEEELFHEGSKLWDNPKIRERFLDDIEGSVSVLAKSSEEKISVFHEQAVTLDVLLSIRDREGRCRLSAELNPLLFSAVSEKNVAKITHDIQVDTGRQFICKVIANLFFSANEHEFFIQALLKNEAEILEVIRGQIEQTGVSSQKSLTELSLSETPVTFHYVSSSSTTPPKREELEKCYLELQSTLGGSFLRVFSNFSLLDIALIAYCRALFSIWSGVVEKNGLPCHEAREKVAIYTGALFSDKWRSVIGSKEIKDVVKRFVDTGKVADVQLQLIKLEVLLIKAIDHSQSLEDIFPQEDIEEGDYEIAAQQMLLFTKFLGEIQPYIFEKCGTSKVLKLISEIDPEAEFRGYFSREFSPTVKYTKVLTQYLRKVFTTESLGAVSRIFEDFNITAHLESHVEKVIADLQRLSTCHRDLKWAFHFLKRYTVLHVLITGDSSVRKEVFLQSEYEKECFEAYEKKRVEFHSQFWNEIAGRALLLNSTMEIKVDENFDFGSVEVDKQFEILKSFLEALLQEEDFKELRKAFKKSLKKAYPKLTSEQASDIATEALQDIEYGRGRCNQIIDEMQECLWAAYAQNDRAPLPFDKDWIKTCIYEEFLNKKNIYFTEFQSCFQNVSKVSLESLMTRFSLFVLSKAAEEKQVLHYSYNNRALFLNRVNCSLDSIEKSFFHAVDNEVEQEDQLSFRLGLSLEMGVMKGLMESVEPIYTFLDIATVLQGKFYQVLKSGGKLHVETQSLDEEFLPSPKFSPQKKKGFNSPLSKVLYQNRRRDSLASKSSVSSSPKSWPLEEVEELTHDESFEVVEMESNSRVPHLLTFFLLDSRIATELVHQVKAKAKNEVYARDKGYHLSHLWWGWEILKSVPPSSKALGAVVYAILNSSYHAIEADLTEKVKARNHAAELVHSLELNAASLGLDLPIALKSMDKGSQLLRYSAQYQQQGSLNRFQKSLVHMIRSAQNDPKYIDQKGKVEEELHRLTLEACQFLLEINGKADETSQFKEQFSKLSASFESMGAGGVSVETMELCMGILKRIKDITLFMRSYTTNFPASNNALGLWRDSIAHWERLEGIIELILTHNNTRHFSFFVRNCVHFAQYAIETMLKSQIQVEKKEVPREERHDLFYLAECLGIEQNLFFPLVGLSIGKGADYPHSYIHKGECRFAAIQYIVDSYELSNQETERASPQVEEDSKKKLERFLVSLSKWLETSEIILKELFPQKREEGSSSDREKPLSKSGRRKKGLFK